MPFKSQKQRRFMYSQHPEIARRWEKETPKGKLPEKKWKDTLPGGRADHEDPSEFDPKELAMGAEDEHGEHTSSWHKAKEIAMDHLVDDPKYYSHQKEREDEAAKKGGENPRKVRLRDGKELVVSFETRPGHELRAYVYDDEAKDYVGSVHVDVNPQKGVAGIEWAGMAKGWRGKGLGSTVYAEVNRELKKRYHLPLSSDEDGMRTDDSEHLWQKLAKLGKAKKAENRYVMEGVWRLVEWDVVDEASDISTRKAQQVVQKWKQTSKDEHGSLPDLSPEDVKEFSEVIGQEIDRNHIGQDAGGGDRLHLMKNLYVFLDNAAEKQDVRLTQGQLVDLVRQTGKGFGVPFPE